MSLVVDFNRLAESIYESLSLELQRFISGRTPFPSPYPTKRRIALVSSLDKIQPSLLVLQHHINFQNAPKFEINVTPCFAL